MELHSLVRVICLEKYAGLLVILELFTVGESLLLLFVLYPALDSCSKLLLHASEKPQLIICM